MTTTRFPNGVTNVGEDSMFADMGQLVPVKYHTYMNDFDTYDPVEWNEQKSIGASVGLSGVDGGWLSMYLPSGGFNSAVINLQPAFSPPYGGVNPSTGVLDDGSLYFETLISCGTLGPQIKIGAAAPNFSDGCWFQREENAPAFTLRILPNGGSEIITPIPEAVISGPYGGRIKLGFVAERGGPIVKIFVNGNFVGFANGGSSFSTSSAVAASALFFSSTFGGTMAIDYMLLAKER